MADQCGIDRSEESHDKNDLKNEVESHEKDGKQREVVIADDLADSARDDSRNKAASAAGEANTKTEPPLAKLCFDLKSTRASIQQAKRNILAVENMQDVNTAVRRKCETAQKKLNFALTALDSADAIALKMQESSSSSDDDDDEDQNATATNSKQTTLAAGETTM